MSSTAVSVDVVNGVVSLGYTGSGTVTGLADLVVLPVVVSQDMATSLSSTEYSFSPLPHVKASGDLVGGRRFVCDAKVMTSPFLQGFFDDANRNDVRRIAFMLRALYEYEEPDIITGQTFYILQENGDKLLQENGDGLLQET